jgi:4-amino-4-deoxy-L-arabinose transferase-like glycosyltransferase
VYHAWKEPLYIVLLAWLTRWTGGSDLAILLFQSIFGVGTAVGVLLISRCLLRDPARAVAAGVLAAINPFLVYYDTHAVHYLSLVTMFFVFLVGTVLMAIRPGQAGASWVVLAGVVMGVALWLRGALLMAGIAAWVVAIVTSAREERLQISRHAAIWLMLAALIISPWLVRNYVLLDRLLFTTDFPHQLWLGNNLLSNGTFSDMKGQRVFFLADAAFQARIRQASELEQHDLFLSEVKRFIYEHPARFAALSGRRLLAFFWFSPNAGVTYTAWQNVLGRIAYVFLFGLGISGLVRYWRRADGAGRRHALIFLASILGLVLVHSLTVINMNHRVPLELGLAVFAAENFGRGATLVHVLTGRQRSTAGALRL